MKKLTTAKIWQFAAGQFGWALLSGIISNWLVYFYQPDETAISQGQTVFIPQGLVIFGVFTIIGGITAFGRIFDAFTDPMIASWSDRCTSKNGRRIPFLKGASLPLALSTVLVFWSPANENSWINAAFLFVMILAYYLSITAYCTPYNALIPELGHTQQERLNISTIISFTFIAGTAVAYLAPAIWGTLIPSFGRVNAIRITFTAMAAAAFIPEAVQGLILTAAAALPMAIFGILPQAVVADIAQSDAITSGSSREGMFYAARTFAFKLGQSLSMLIFTAVSTIGNGSGAGYRIAAFGAAVFCGAGGLILMFYDEKKINCVMNGKA